MSSASGPDELRGELSATTPSQWTLAPQIGAWSPSTRWNGRVQPLCKRTLDIVGALAALVLTAPIIMTAAVMIRTTSPGPILFRQRRIGKNGQPFDMLKLRTMYVNNDNSAHHDYYVALVRGRAKPNGKTFKLVDDPRITRVGRILRRLSIDELPQLINVLKGEMSLVGPRPPLKYEVDLYDEEARRRLLVKPGMTGLWQVSGRNALNFRQMIALDLQYISNWSLATDLRILVLTPWVVLKAVGVG